MEENGKLPFEWMEIEPKWQRLKPMISSRVIKDLSYLWVLLQFEDSNMKPSYQQNTSVKKPKVLKNLQLAKEHTNWPKEKWYNILWTDVSKIVLFGCFRSKGCGKFAPNVSGSQQQLGSRPTRSSWAGILSTSGRSWSTPCTTNVKQFSETLVIQLNISSVIHRKDKS